MAAFAARSSICSTGRAASSGFTSTERHKDQLRRLRNRGICISLDDFGTGHSSLGYLRDFAVDCLKIDRGFVGDLERSETSQIFVSAIAHVGRGLGMTVVAEGIETEDQARMLRSAGCNHTQGYLFARPIPAVEIAALLEAGSADADRIWQVASRH